MVTEITDEELVNISYQIDNFLYELFKTKEMAPINLSGIVVARLIRMNESVSSEEDFYKLLHSIANKRHLELEQRTLQ